MTETSDFFTPIFYPFRSLSFSVEQLNFNHEYHLLFPTYARRITQNTMNTCIAGFYELRDESTII